MSEQNKTNNQLNQIGVGKSFFSSKKKTTQPGRRLGTKILWPILILVVVLGGGGYFAYTQLNSNQAEPEVSSFTSETSEIPGWWYQEYFGKSVCDNELCKPDNDPDGDKLTNRQEFYYHSNPLNAYTVEDELNDGELVAAGYDPSKPGRVTFDEILTDEYVFGEGLLLENDIQELITETQDISKVQIPLVNDSELNISYGYDQETYERYVSDLETNIENYFPSSQLAVDASIFESQSGSELEDARSRAKLLSEKLKDISVPIKFITFHKYNIAFFSLLSEIIPGPPETLLSDIGNVTVDAWYDRAQAFFVVQQKLDFERQLLNKELGL